MLSCGTHFEKRMPLQQQHHITKRWSGDRLDCHLSGGNPRDEN